MDQIIHSFHGKPDTRQSVDRDGNLTLSITPRELTPLTARKPPTFWAWRAPTAFSIWAFILATPF